MSRLDDSCVDLHRRSAEVMGRKPPPSQKYGAPLYAVAWLSPEVLFIAGGGGKKSSGIKNRCVCGLGCLHASAPLQQSTHK